MEAKGMMVRCDGWLSAGRTLLRTLLRALLRARRRTWQTARSDRAGM